MPETIRTDAIVVGAGLGGHCAALAAAERGLNVLLIEKLEQFGGSSALAGGGLAFAGTELQRSQGIEDSADALRDHLVRAGQGHGDPATIDAYVTHQELACAWLTELGADFTLAETKPPRRLHAMPTGALVKHLHGLLMDRPDVRYMAGVAAERLIAAEGRIGAVTVSRGDEQWTIAAEAGVVLATGGFARSGELIAELAPQCAGAIPMGGRGSHGDGIRLARACGAALVDMEYVEASFGASTLSGAEARLLYAQSDGAVIVNRQGRRFVDESRDIKVLGRATAEQEDGVAFQIFDAATMARSRPVPNTRDFAAAARDGLIVSAPTVAALARSLGIDPEGLGQTLTGDGVVTTAPFHGYPCRTGLTSTYGGLRVDAGMRVLDHSGRPIPGLFAAGEVVGGLHGAGYLVGTALGKAAVFGMVAGQSVAAALARSPA